MNFENDTSKVIYQYIIIMCYTILTYNKWIHVRHLLWIFALEFLGILIILQVPTLPTEKKKEIKNPEPYHTVESIQD